MATKRLLMQSIARSSATQMHELGERWIEPATTNTPEAEYKYVKYDDGTANITANTHQLLVPHSSNLQLYTGDKTNMSSVSDGRFSGVCMSDVSTTSNKYIWIQIRGESWLRAAGATTAAGEQLVATPAGTDLQAERLVGLTNFALAASLTATTQIYRAVGSAFGVANAAAAETTSQLGINLLGH